jgi:geranylgeranyl pyrophosphate synthase
MESEVKLASGEPLWTTRSSVFIRGEGGWGGDRGPSGPQNEPPSDTAPHHEVTMQTSPDQAFVYRLSGDRNPLHTDPSFAAIGGFDRPILHGLCTYGFTGRALLGELCGNDVTKFHHVEGRFQGDADHYGKSSAILLGDLLLSWADDQFLGAALSVDAQSARTFRSELRTMRSDVTAGQFLDNHDSVAWRNIDDANAIERAQRVVIYKSAKYSVEAPLVLGAILGGAPSSLISALRGFALPLGFAFQLRDDLLGVFGDEETTGKPAGDDLREGKRTVLLAIARQNADRGTVTVFDELIGDPRLEPAQIDMLRATLIATGVVQQIEDLIATSRDRSLRSLAEMGVDSSVEHELRSLVDAITVRTV